MRVCKVLIIVFLLSLISIQSTNVVSVSGIEVGNYGFKENIFQNEHTKVILTKDEDIFIPLLVENCYATFDVVPSFLYENNTWITLNKPYKTIIRYYDLNNVHYYVKKRVYSSGLIFTMVYRAIRDGAEGEKLYLSFVFKNSNGNFNSSLIVKYTLHVRIYGGVEFVCFQDYSHRNRILNFYSLARQKTLEIAYKIYNISFYNGKKILFGLNWEAIDTEMLNKIRILYSQKEKEVVIEFGNVTLIRRNTVTINYIVIDGGGGGSLEPSTYPVKVTSEIYDENGDPIAKIGMAIYGHHDDNNVASMPFDEACAHKIGFFVAYKSENYYIHYTELYIKWVRWENIYGSKEASDDPNRVYYYHIDDYYQNSQLYDELAPIAEYLYQIATGFLEYGWLIPNPMAFIRKDERADNIHDEFKIYRQGFTSITPDEDIYLFSLPTDLYGAKFDIEVISSEEMVSGTIFQFYARGRVIIIYGNPCSSLFRDVYEGYVSAYWNIRLRHAG